MIMRLAWLIALTIVLRVQGNTQVTKTVHNDSAFRSAVLNGHNLQRKQVGVAPLQWSASLAEEALVWAKRLALKGGGPEHDLNRKNRGENIWAGTANRRTYTEMVSAWTKEKKDFVYGPLDYANLAKVGHYTQMIWQRTTQVGCALASNGKIDYLVCRYLPQGNVTGQKPYQ